MDPSMQNAPTIDEDDEWDTDGFVIPSLGIEDTNETTTDAPQVEESKDTIKDKKEENIYLGPHGAPPSQAKQDVNYSGRKQRFKQKLKDADQRIGGSGRENKLENLRDLVGGGKMPVNSPKSSARDWLDPHCHESQFEKRVVYLVKAYSNPKEAKRRLFMEVQEAAMKDVERAFGKLKKK